MEMLFIGWFFLAVVIGAVAAIKEKNFALWFFLSLLLSPLLAGFCLIITLMPSQSNNASSTKNNNNASSSIDDFEEKWITLIKYDEGIKNAVKQLEVYGSDAIDELKKVLRATNDHTRLPIAADQIAKEFKVKFDIKNQERAAQEAREIQNKIGAEKRDHVAQAARKIQDKIDAENKIIFIRYCTRYALIPLAAICIVTASVYYGSSYIRNKDMHEAVIEYGKGNYLKALSINNSTFAVVITL